MTKMWNLLQQDAARWLVPGQIGDASTVTFGAFLKLYFRYMGLRATTWFRIASWFKQKKIPYFPGALQRGLMKNFGFEIMSGADIGGGLYVAHPAGTTIMVRHLGVNASIIAAITIGMRNEWVFPHIGDRVFIGAGARVLGNITVGNDVVIGANAVVLQDVPDRATVVGIPGRVVKIRDA